MAAGAAAQALEELVGRAATRREQRRWVAVAVGALLRVALWYAPPAVLPGEAGNWLAAALIGGNLW